MIADRRSLRRCVLATAIVLAWPSIAAAAPEPGVVVDASGLEAVGEELAPEVSRELEALLEREGLAASSLRVRIIWLDAEAFHYSIYASFDPAVPDDQIALVETCRGCSKGDVVKKAVAGVEKLVPEEKQRLAKLEPPEPVADEPPPPAPVDRPPAKPQGLQRMGWTGVGLLVTGAAAAITGGALLGVGTTRPEADMSQIRDFRPTGYVLLGTGGALLVVGAILLGVDRARAKKASKTGQSARLRTGLLGGRF